MIWAAMVRFFPRFAAAQNSRGLEDAHGRTALQIAVESSFEDAVTLLS